jgi:hypothetical protein
MTVTPATSYAYTVAAFDQAGNTSLASDPASVTTLPMPASLTFTSEADTYVNAGSPSTNYGSSTTFRADATPDVHAYLRFTVKGLAGQPVTRARLVIYSNSTSSLGVNALAVSDSSWAENAVTYDIAPPMGAILGSSGPITTGAWVTIDVTAYINSEGVYNIGINTSSATALSFATRESGANAPQLIIDLQ